MCVCVCIYPTVGDKCPASQHSSQHELGHSQQSTHEAAHYRHTEEEVVLNKHTEDRDREVIICIRGCAKLHVLDNMNRGKES